MMEQSNVTWPGWEVVRKIGAGSFGAVYEIRRDVFGREERAALKVLSIPESPEEVEELYAEGYDEASITTHYKEHLGEIVREYSLMLDMKGHTNVVYCDDLKYIPHDDGVGWDIYIKMELLTPLMKAVGNEYSEAQTVRLGIDMCNALILCKQENIVHRDIKPQNMFVSKTGDYKLGDFGVAKVSEKTASGTKVGTFEYMAPEVYRGQPYGSGADLYSLGMVLYWMMNQKRTPFLPLPPQIPSATAKEEARNRRFQGEALPEPANGSDELKRIVLKACAYDPKERYASAADMQADLKKLDTGAAFVPPVVSAAPAEAAPDEGTVNIFSGTASGSFKLGTDAFEEKTEYIPRDSAEEKTEYIREEQTVYIPRQTAVQVEEPEKKKKKGKGILFILLAVVAVVVVVLLMLKSCGGDAKPSETLGQQSSAGEQAGSQGSGEETRDSQEESSEMTDGSSEATEESTEASEEATEESTEATRESTEATEESTEATETEPVKVEVPNVVGKAKDTAVSTLEKLGFAVETQYAKDNSVAEGNVISQSVSAGTKLEEGSEILLTVSSGKETVSVSNVVGKTKADAESALEKQGFKVTFTEEYSASVDSGKVISQSPKAGSSQYVGTTITVVISKGPIVPTGVSLNKTSATLQIHGTLQLSATVSPSNAHDTSVTWSSSDSSVAMVSADGLVTAKKAGTATITVKTNSGAKTATCKITVSAPTIGSVSNQSIFVGDSVSVSMPSVTPTGATVLNFSVTSSNTSVATVSMSGGSSLYMNINGVGAGTATVTVTYTAGGSSVKTSFTVTVTAPKVTVSSTSVSGTWDLGTQKVYTTYNKPSFPVTLPTATSNTGDTVKWKVVSGDAFVSGGKVYITNPAETVTVQAYFTRNGTTYYANVTAKLTLKKTTSAANSIKSSASKSSSTLGSVPKGATVTITKVVYDYSTKDSDGRYWAWGYVNYNGIKGWIVVF